jgi:diguanylate cyclase (GGDEF)-like protein
MALLAIYLAAGLFALELATPPAGFLSLVWLPAGVSLVACVRFGREVWPVLWLGAFLVNALDLFEPGSGAPLLAGLAVCAGSASISVLVQALLAHHLFLRWVPGSTIDSTRDVLGLLEATLLPSALNALLLTVLLAASGHMPATGLLDLALSWALVAMADYHGYFVAAVFGLAWVGTGRGQRSVELGRTSFLAILVLPLLLGASVLWNGSAIFLLTTLGILVVMRWGLGATTAFVLFISLVMSAATAAGLPPLAGGTALGSMTTLLLFVFGLGAPLYLLAAYRRELLRSKLELELNVHQRTSALSIANQRLESLSNSDALTGLANRRHFDQVLDKEWRRACRSHHALSLCMIDVDWFKAYNDHYGHLAGDRCLRQVAQLISQYARRGSDLAARYGGEEFVVLVADPASCDLAALAQGICQSVRDAGLPHAASPVGMVTVSIGVATLHPRSDLPQASLVQAADRALYQAKALGRNRLFLA